MKCIVSGTNRSHSKTLEICQQITDIYKDLRESSEILDLKEVPFFKIKEPYSPHSLEREMQIMNQSTGIVLAVPEYKGSFPGILKYFLDHWDENPDFLRKGFCLVGIGSSYTKGWLAVQNIQSLLFRKKAYIFPDYVLISADDSDPSEVQSRLRKQAKNFCSFTKKIL